MEPSARNLIREMERVHVWNISIYIILAYIYRNRIFIKI